MNINLSEVSIINFLFNFNKAETLKKIYLEYVEFVVYFLIKSCELIIFVLITIYYISFDIFIFHPSDRHEFIYMYQFYPRLFFRKCIIISLLLKKH